MLTVLQNLIDNSLNAMGGKGTLSITTSLLQSLQTETTHDQINAVQLEIADTGKGIAKEELNQLFQPFFSKSPEGTGLGLVITKKILEDHNSTIRIESESGIGTTVIVTIPADA